jgi:hypothetical protein
VASFLCDLGIFVNSDFIRVPDSVALLFRSLPATQSSSSCFSLRFYSLIATLVVCRLGYDSGTLVGLPFWFIRWLQSVQNVAARLVFRLRCSALLLMLLLTLIGYLCVPERITFKISVLAYHLLRGVAPRTFACLLASLSFHIGVASGQQLLVLRLSVLLVFQLSAVVYYLLLMMWNGLPTDVSSSP